MNKNTQTRWKMLNGLCVPISTPSNYFAESARRWLRNHRELVKAGRSLTRLNAELERNRNEYEEES